MLEVSNLYYRDRIFNFIINNRVYNEEQQLRNVDVNEILENWDPVSSFNVNLNGYEVFTICWDNTYMIYQKVDDEIIELIPRNGEPRGEILHGSLPIPSEDILEDEFLAIRLVPYDEEFIYNLDLIHVNSSFNNTLRLLHSLSLTESEEESLPELEDTSDHVLPSDLITGRNVVNSDRMYPRDLFTGRRIINPEEHFRNYPNLIQESIIPPNSLMKESYETHLKNIYNIPYELPEFLILENGIKADFISLDKYKTLSIAKLIVEPILQPWSGKYIETEKLPMRIITLFSNDGMTYLIKARYNQERSELY